MKNVIICVSIAIGTLIAIIVLTIFLYWVLSEAFYFENKEVIALCCAMMSISIIFITANILIS